VNWKRAFTVSLAVGAPILGLLAWGMTRDPREIASKLPGRPAPPFTKAVFAEGGTPALRLPKGDSVRLAALRGHVVVINFWASWCLACRTEHQDLSTVANRYADRPVRFLGLLYNDRESNGLAWIDQMGGQAYPSLSDPGARTAIDYGLYGVPETFVIDKAGRVAHKYVGPVQAAPLTALIDSLLAAP
jgi:cytochrome c biogenesis protein CcmG/thiol:disulfide interchange protein DsbE